VHQFAEQSLQSSVLLVTKLEQLIFPLCNYILISTVCQQSIENILAGLERIELPPSVSKTEMISISPKPVIGPVNRNRTCI